MCEKIILDSYIINLLTSVAFQKNYGQYWSGFVAKDMAEDIAKINSTLFIFIADCMCCSLRLFFCMNFDHWSQPF